MTPAQYEGPNLEGYRSEVDLEDLESLLIASREHIYSHPIRTLVQEYVNNGKDANIQAGTPYYKMDIVVPTYSRMEAVFRDYGVGLTKEEIIQVYRKIGKSTKRTNKNLDEATNKMNKKLAGKYGVGAKVGFVYSDAFFITSWKNGKKVECVAHKANSLIGDYTFISETDSDEPNGVQISIKIDKTGDLQSFRDAVYRMFYLWPEKPNIIGHEYEWPTTVYEDEAMRTISSNNKQSDNKGLWLDIDGTPYRINDATKKKCGIDMSFFKGDLYIKTTHDDVDVPMNREEVQTNSKLDAYLRGISDRIEEAERKIVKEALSKTDFQTLSELDKYLGKLRNRYNIKDVEVYVDVIGRKISHILTENSYKFSMEPLDGDKFVKDKTEYKVSRYSQEFINPNIIQKYNVHVSGEFDFKTEEAMARKYRSWARSVKERVFVWRNTDNTPVDENIIKFIGIQSYDEMFPPKPKYVRPAYERGEYTRTRNDIVYYNRHLSRDSVMKESFQRTYPIGTTIYYSLFNNNEHTDCILYENGDVIGSDLDRKHKEKIGVIGLIPKNLKTLIAWNCYTLVPLPEKFEDYVFSSQTVEKIMNTAASNSISDIPKLRNKKFAADPDIAYLQSLFKRREKADKDTFTDSNLKKFPENLREMYKKELKEVAEDYKQAERKVYAKYEVLRNMQDYEVKRLEDWISTFLIPLSLQKLEPTLNTSESQTIVLN